MFCEFIADSIAIASSSRKLLCHSLMPIVESGRTIAEPYSCQSPHYQQSFESSGTHIKNVQQQLVANSIPLSPCWFFMVSLIVVLSSSHRSLSKLGWRSFENTIMQERIQQVSKLRPLITPSSTHGFCMKYIYSLQLLIRRLIGTVPALQCCQFVWKIWHLI